MQIAQDPTLDEIKARLAKALNPKKIYLYGSRAKGTARKDSDYDILVLIEDSDRSQHERNVEARMALWDIGVPVDVVVCTQQEFDELKNELSSLPEIVMHHGRELELG